MVNKIGSVAIKATLEKARASPRRRAIYCMHGSADEMQRMINAGFSDTYMRPHMHDDKDKIEVFCLLEGTVGMLIFGDDGNIKEKILLSKDGNRIVEIQPRTWHSFVIISKQAVLYEVKNGYYDEKKDKIFPSWAPKECTKQGQIYLEKLKKVLRQ